MDVTKFQPFGRIYLAPKPVPHGSFWATAPRENFIAFCSAILKAPIPVEDVTAREAQIIQRRQDVLAALVGLQATRHREIRHANVLSRN